MTHFALLYCLNNLLCCCWPTRCRLCYLVPISDAALPTGYCCGMVAILNIDGGDLRAVKLPTFHYQNGLPTHQVKSACTSSLYCLLAMLDMPHPLPCQKRSKYTSPYRRRNISRRSCFAYDGRPTLEQLTQQRTYPLAKQKAHYTTAVRGTAVYGTFEAWTSMQTAKLPHTYFIGTRARLTT